MSEMTAGEVLEQLIVTKEQVDEATGKIIPEDFKIKSAQGYTTNCKSITHQKKAQVIVYPGQRPMDILQSEWVN